MRFRLFIAFLAVAALAGCGDSPTEPTKPEKVCPPLTLNPIIVHMKVGESQVFTASGGDPASQYVFNFSYDFYAGYGSLSADSVAGTATFVAICRTGEVACSPDSGGQMAEYLTLLARNRCGSDENTAQARIYITNK